MAITPTGAIFKTLSFDGTSLRSYGVYISGEATFNAPAREVEMISIPGRSGQLALDKGRFENIEVTYPAGIYADTEADFAEAVSELRNFLCSRSGYCRIEDDYNPNEFRMGIYKSGLEVTPALLKAGEFDLVFDCKPQRWLKSGEDKISVQDGDTITNPTLFEAKPQLQVWGYGDISINSETITVVSEYVGDVMLYPQTTISIGGSLPLTQTFSVEAQKLNNGDNIGDVRVTWYMYPNLNASVQIDTTSANVQLAIVHNHRTLEAEARFTSLSKGTSCTGSATVDYTVNGNSYQTKLDIAYDGDATFSVTVSDTNTQSISKGLSVKEIDGNSTRTTTGNPLYIDLDIGEAWNEDSGVPISVNNAVQLPSDLPSFQSGGNTITYDNTITQFKVVPRWWKV